MFLISQNISVDVKGPKVNINCTNDDVRGLFLGMPHRTIPPIVITNKNIIMSSFKSSRDIQKKEGIVVIKTRLRLVNSA